MQAFAIKRLSTGLYWTGSTWGPLNKAREWAKEETAKKRALKIAEALPGEPIAVVQTV